MPAPLPENELQRLDALYRYGILDTMPEAAFDRITHLAARALHVDTAILNFIDEDRQWSKACHGDNPLSLPRNESFCAWAILQPDVLLIPDTHADARVRDTPLATRHPRVRAYAGAPLVTPDGHAIGTLCVTHEEPREFTPRDVDVLRELAALAVDELELRLRTFELDRQVRENTLITRDLRRTRSYAETLVAVGSLIELDLEPLDMTRHVVEIVAKEAGVDWAGLTIIEGDHARTIPAFTTPGVPEAFHASATSSHARGRGLVWHALEGHRAAYADDYATDGHARPELASSGVRAAAAIPLGTHGVTSYVLIAARFGEQQTWTAQERALFEAAARSVSIALERRARLQQLEQAAFTDPDTGLGNYRAFTRDLDGALARDESGVVVTLNLLGVRRTNDTEGLDRGDELIRTFASVLVTALNATERTYRRGGNEFLLLLRPGAHALVTTPGTPSGYQQEAEARLRRVQEIVRRHGFTHVQARLGTAVFPRDGTNARELLRLAEQRLRETHT